jgi:hypothetical protein
MIGEERSTFIRLVVTSVVAFIPEIMFSWVIGKIISTSMWYVWIGLQVIKLFLWILRNTVFYVLFHLLWKNGMIESTYSSLVEHQYPNPRKYDTTIIASKDYFFDVMTDDELEMKTRLDAAQTYGVASNWVSTLGFFEAMRIDKVYIKAINKYHRINFSGKDYQGNPDEG